MNSTTVYQMIESSGLMAGMRGNFPPEVALKVAAALVEEGITVFEFTLNSVKAIEAMKAVKAEFGDEVASGMGTVLDVENADRVLDAGADFIVSPAFSPAVVEKVVNADILVAPGVITPTECVDAWAMGVKLLKIFPVGPLGLDYFKAVRGPLDHMKFMANGGIDPETTRDFIKAGAIAAGAASWLTGKGDMPIETVRQRARALIAAVDEARTGQPRKITV
ncbi:MAG: bifunctional 4-hydroxy-2-oxoglutarate aldolase/2-dehydro-3-deoxy-phosphogluconate aldolase [Anaerolineae bacterium]|nr:bifunctional 4-hydroxy-2-oxoglutarate aldolase/2-dehydro-3-deoxy-phosphogluconate aldolase [Anaerolineae bacterium]